MLDVKDDCDSDILLLGGLNSHSQNFKNQYPYSSNPWSSLVLIRDVPPSATAADAGTNDNPDNDFSIFPPSNHENLFPAQFDPDPPKNPPPPQPPSPPSPSSPSSAFSFPPSDVGPPPPSPPSPPSLPTLPLVFSWWNFALQILRSRIGDVGSYFLGCNGSGAGKGRVLWSSGNVGLALVVVGWWLWMRIRRRRRKEESVGNLLKIIREKDEKIMQLLNQISQMNEVLLARHKVMVSKLAN